MRVLASESLDRSRCTTVRVALTQNRVYSAAENAGVTGLGFFFFIGLCIFNVLRHIVTLLLQLFDGGTQLGNGSTDIRQFDDVGVRIFGQLTQESETVFNALLFGEALGEGGKNTGSQGDSAQTNFNKIGRASCR